MKKDGGVSIIPCKVNGLNLNFIFDTGASDVSISMTEADFMIKNGYLSKSDIVGSNKYLDANGNLNVGVIINLKEIEIGGLKLFNVKASVVKNNKAPLLLGQSAIGKLGKIQLDLEQNTLTILSSGITKSKEVNQQQSESFSESPSENNIIGHPYKIGNLEIAEHEFQDRMNWLNATTACSDLGYGWRLPTIVELVQLYEFRGFIGGFNGLYYWSSTETDDSHAKAYSKPSKYFPDGLQANRQKISTYNLRAVRSL